MTFTEAIEKKYITDYRIWLPSIHEDTEKLDNELSVYEIDAVIKAKCTFLFSCLLNNGSKKCIVYCIDNEEINIMREAMIKLNEFYVLDYEMDQITASDSEKKRMSILEKFEDGKKIQLLFSIRILDECIDIPKCDSIYITYPSQSKIRTIQRMCRCIRTNKNNGYKVGNVFIWCDEYDKILETLSGIKEYDLFFKDKIKINETDFYGENKSEGIEVDNKLIEKYVLGIKEFRVLSWEEKLDNVKKYIDENDELPSKHNKNKEIKKYGLWILFQKQKYNKQIMYNLDRYKLWEDFINKYKKHFQSNEENWKINLEIIKKYIDDNDKRPSEVDKNTDVKKLGQWLSTQQIQYKNKYAIMSNLHIQKLWEEFINNVKYKKYFQSNKEDWKDKLSEVKIYLDKNNKNPSIHDKNIDIKKLGQWLGTQQKNYKNKEWIMKNVDIQKLWEDFINNVKYKKNFHLYMIKIWK